MDLSILLAETTPLPEQRVEPVIPTSWNGIAIVGDMPYNPQVTLPFTNAHYGTLMGLTKKAGFSFTDCIQANVLKFHAAHNTIGETYEPVAKQTVEELAKLFETFKPKVILLLGRQVIHLFKPGSDYLDEERGSPFRWRGHLCIPTFHPRELYAQWKFYNVVLADFQKALRLGNEGWSEPVYDIVYQPSLQECISFLQWIINNRPYLTVDIETQENHEGKGYLTCCGFAINGKKAFVIPFIKEGNKPYFAFHEELLVWKYLSKALEVGRYLGQFAAHYDHWYLAYWCKILLNVVDDTMFAQWEIYTELPKSLGFLSAMYTDNAYHKDMLKLARTNKIPRNQEFYYCGLDNVITYQCALSIGQDMRELPPEVKQHYRFNIRLSRVFQYMSLRGGRLNRELRDHRLSELRLEELILQEKLILQSKKDKLNVNSPKQMTNWLYQELKLPPKYKQVKMEDGEVEDRETADFLSLAYLAREFPGEPALMTAALLRKLKKRISSLKAIDTGPNGEIYWQLNTVGTETGRASCTKPWNGLGIQSQNVDRRDRDLVYPPEVGQMWAKCDLEGADSWTVAAQLMKLGDDTMWKDLKAGLKPAMILALAREFDQTLISADQATILEVLKPVKKTFKTDKRLSDLYETCKSVSHGTNYMMQAQTMHMTIFKKSKAEIYIPVMECEKLRLLYLKRYPGLIRFYSYIPSLINTHGYIDCPSGMRRVFFGHNDNHQARVGMALLPQNNTGWATNRMLHNLYYQPYNRRVNSNRLILEPINQVHDEGDLAFYANEIGTVRDIFTRAVDFTSEIWGIEFKIPFDPNYGPNWGDCNRDLFE